VLVAGGFDGSTQLASAELYTPSHLEEVSMSHGDVGRFGAIRAPVLVAQTQLEKEERDAVMQVH
jgi:hypothetical protein